MYGMHYLRGTGLNTSQFIKGFWGHIFNLLLSFSAFRKKTALTSNNHRNKTKWEKIHVFLLIAN